MLCPTAQDMSLVYLTCEPLGAGCREDQLARNLAGMEDYLGDDRP